MAFGDNERRSRIIPNEDGKGNTVFLESLPIYNTEGKKDAIVFTFVEEIDGELHEYVHRQLDPFSADTEKIKKGGLARLFHLYGAMVPPDKYEALKQYDESNDETIEPLMEFANSLLDESVFEKPLQLLITYNKNGYLTLPVVGDVMSSEYKKKKLVWSAASNTTLTPVAGSKSPDNDVAPSSSSDM